MSRYNNTPNITSDNISGNGTTVYNVPAESVDDIYLISTLGDRFDILAQEYYKDSSLWYIIAAANPTLRRDTLLIEPGIQLRIPLPLSKVLAKLRSDNTSR
jgi:nucleoid-associated protein YgaU